MQNFFPFDFKKIILAIFVFALPLISINFQRAPGETAWYMRPIDIVAGAVNETYSNFSHSVRSTTGLYLDLINIKKDSARLKTELSILSAKMARYDELLTENQRLARLLDFKAQTPSELLPSRVIGQDLFSGQHRTLRINKGSSQKVVRGQAVLSPDGAVGYIFSVEPESSQVLVVTDRYAVIDALVHRTRARGIVEGRTSTTSHLKYLHRNDDVEVGDIVVTSGLDNIFPQGFPLARVTSVEKKTFDITQRVELEPLVKLSRLEEVFVVLRAVHPPAEPTPAAKADTNIKDSSSREKEPKRP